MELPTWRVLAAYLLGTTRQTSRLFAILMIVSIGVALTAMYAGFTVDPVYFWRLGLLLPLGIADFVLYRRMKAQQMLDRLRENWGREQDRRRVFPMIESLHRLREPSGLEDGTSIDDQTWNDLNMNEVYAKIDRTLTNPGECVLYRLLRTPLLSEAELHHRSQVIRLFQTDHAVRERVRFELQRLGRWDTNVITSLTWGEVSSRRRRGVCTRFWR